MHYVTPSFISIQDASSKLTLQTDEACKSFLCIIETRLRNSIVKDKQTKNDFHKSRSLYLKSINRVRKYLIETQNRHFLSARKDKISHNLIHLFRTKQALTI